MSRYILGALLGLLGLLAIYSLINNRDLVRQIPQASRDAISSIPTSAADELTGIESAGQNVIRQTSEAGQSLLRNAQNGSPTPVAENTVPPAQEDFPTQNLDAVQPVEPAGSTPTDQEAIPALW